MIKYILLGLLISWSSLGVAMTDREIIDIIKPRLQQYAVGVVEKYKSPNCSNGYAAFFIPTGIDYGVIAFCDNARLPISVMVRHELAHVAQWCAGDKSDIVPLKGYLDLDGITYAFAYPRLDKNEPRFYVEAQADTVMRTMDLNEVLDLVDTECQAYMGRLLNKKSPFLEVQ